MRFSSKVALLASSPRSYNADKPVEAISWVVVFVSPSAAKSASCASSKRDSSKGMVFIFVPFFAFESSSFASTASSETMDAEEMDGFTREQSTAVAPHRISSRELNKNPTLDSPSLPSSSNRYFNIISRRAFRLPTVASVDSSPLPIFTEGVVASVPISIESEFGSFGDSNNSSTSRSMSRTNGVKLASPPSSLAISVLKTRSDSP